MNIPVILGAVAKETNVVPAVRVLLAHIKAFADGSLAAGRGEDALRELSDALGGHEHALSVAVAQNTDAAAVSGARPSVPAAVPTRKPARRKAATRRHR